MATRVQYGTPEMCIAMDLPDWRLWSPESSGATESVNSNPSGISMEDRNDIQGSDRAEPLVGVKVVSYWSVYWAHMFLHAYEDFDVHSEWAGCWELCYGGGDIFPSDCILLFVQGKDNLGVMMKMLNGGIS